MPDLSSITADAIAAALSEFRTGKRQATLMPRLVQGFTDAETRAIATALGRRP